MVESNYQAMQVQHINRLRQYNQPTQADLADRQEIRHQDLEQAHRLQALHQQHLDSAEAALEAYLAVQYRASEEVLAERQRLQQQQVARRLSPMQSNHYYKEWK